MGTADAVYQNIYSIGSEQPKHVLILSGDHIYKMTMARCSSTTTRPPTSRGTIQIAPDEVSRFGVVEVDRDHRVNGFQENRSRPA
jgi:glucose-1-phosphate adenylyltransferase